MTKNKAPKDIVDQIVSINEFKELCLLTLELTKLRQNECKHLGIEDYAPKLLAQLLSQLLLHKKGYCTIPGKGEIDK